VTHSTDGNIFCRIIYSHHDRRAIHMPGLGTFNPTTNFHHPTSLASSTFISSSTHNS
jgi:hypothetical protein